LIVEAANISIFIEYTYFHVFVKDDSKCG